MDKISVISVSLHGSPLLDESLHALEKQRGAGEDAEIIVVSYSQNGTVEHIKKQFPRIKFLQPSERLGIPQLRALGMSHATGDIIAITEDCCVPGENWFEEIRKAHGLGYEVVGGAIEKGSANKIVNWAVYLCEYSQAMLPIPSGEVAGVAGNNASYKREVLDKVDESIKRDYWEFFLHEELRKQKVKFLSAPAMVVVKKKEFNFLYFLTQRFHYSRSFAGMRRTRISASRRILCVLISPLLPLLMTWRIAQQVHQKKRYYKEFFMSLPLLTIFMISYAAGEFVGYLFGPGKSLSKVE
jgi:glycosyltransferase involved in cell wall biosynthesis